MCSVHGNGESNVCLHGNGESNVCLHGNQMYVHGNAWEIMHVYMGVGNKMYGMGKWGIKCIIMYMGMGNQMYNYVHGNGESNVYGNGNQMYMCMGVKNIIMCAREWENQKYVHLVGEYNTPWLYYALSHQTS